jgi:hypothetical protein
MEGREDVNLIDLLVKHDLPLSLAADEDDSSLPINGEEREKFIPREERRARRNEIEKGGRRMGRVSTRSWTRSSTRQSKGGGRSAVGR